MSCVTTLTPWVINDRLSYDGQPRAVQSGRQRTGHSGSHSPCDETRRGSTHPYQASRGRAGPPPPGSFRLPAHDKSQQPRAGGCACSGTSTVPAHGAARAHPPGGDQSSCPRDDEAAWVAYGRGGSIRLPSPAALAPLGCCPRLDTVSKEGAGDPAVRRGARRPCARGGIWCAARSPARSAASR